MFSSDGFGLRDYQRVTGSLWAGLGGPFLDSPEHLVDGYFTLTLGSDPGVERDQGGGVAQSHCSRRVTRTIMAPRMGLRLPVRGSDSLIRWPSDVGGY